MPHAVVVEDDSAALEALVALVDAAGFEVRGAPTLAAARAACAERRPDVVLADLSLPDGDGLSLLDEPAAAGAQVVVITGHASVESAVEALRRGAADYLTKPIDVARLTAILGNVARTRDLQQEIGSLRGALRDLGRFGPLVGASAAMGAVYDLVARVAPTDATVFVVGESGTGKEVVAQAVHDLSRRRRAPFVPVNCGAISPALIESALFGHEKGAFTGADKLHRGVFEQADGGTLFLDEVTEMPIELQVKLLRVLETGAVTRVGGETPIAVDVRVVAATNRDPQQAVRDGRLREDLWYRLNVFPLCLPPLRDRHGDVRLLAEHFLAALNTAHGTAKRWSEAALRTCEAHDWPGNVRELKNAVHRAYILADETIDAVGLPEPAVCADADAAAGDTAPSFAVRVGSSIAAVEKRLLLATLAHVDGNRQQAAALLGISLKTLYNRLNAYRES